jgi:uncharacterized protein with HEPN domain
MLPDVAKKLLDTLQAVRRACEFTAGIDFQTFSRSTLVRAAVERQLEITGEALGRAAILDSAPRCGFRICGVSLGCGIV